MFLRQGWNMSTQFRLLIIDDEVSIRDGFKRFLSVSLPDLDVITAPDGIVGLNRAQLDHPDLILLDLGMPEMTGFEVLAQLRFMSIKTPVIVMTAFDTEDNKDMVRVTSNDENVQILRKPIAPDQLLALLKTAMGVV
jgi:DNA-binding response OmpR family regulator